MKSTIFTARNLDVVTCPVEFLLAQFLSVSFVLVGVGVGFSLVLCLWKSLMLALLTDTEGGDPHWEGWDFRWPLSWEVSSAC